MQEAWPPQGEFVYYGITKIIKDGKSTNMPIVSTEAIVPTINPINKIIPKNKLNIKTPFLIL